jgi:DNA-binding response OmpR family regulator
MASILIVDDDQNIRDLITAILTDEGHHVVCAHNGEHALEVLSQRIPDIMVLDVMMPLIDGYGVLKALKSRRQGTKVLMLTAKNRETDWLKGYQSGAHLYLTKPFDPQELSDSIERLLHMGPTELHDQRDDELDRARLLAKLESLFDPGSH